MAGAIPFGVLALVLGAYGLVMLRRRARLRGVAAELGAEYLDEGWTKPGGVSGQGYTIRIESPRRSLTR